MKTTIRNNTFETNSSSVHAFVYLDEYDYERWKREEVALDLLALQHDYSEWTWESDDIDGGNYLIEADEAMEVIRERIGETAMTLLEELGKDYDPTDAEVFFCSDCIYSSSDETDGRHGLEFDYMA